MSVKKIIVSKTMTLFLTSTVALSAIPAITACRTIDDTSELSKIECEIPDKLKVVQAKIEENGYSVGIDISYAQDDGIFDIKEVFKSYPEINHCTIRISNCWCKKIEELSNEQLAEIKKQRNYDAIIDSCFLKQALACRDAGIPIGVYFWPYCLDKERNILLTEIIINYLNLIKIKYGINVDLQVGLDIEYGDATELVDRFNAYDNYVRDNLQDTIDMLVANDYCPVIYCNGNSYDAIFKPDVISGEKMYDYRVPVWIAYHVDDLNDYVSLKNLVGPKMKNYAQSHNASICQVSKKYKVNVNGEEYQIDCDIILNFNFLNGDIKNAKNK